MSLFRRKAVVVQVEPVVVKEPAVVEQPEREIDPDEAEYIAKREFNDAIWEMELNARDAGHSLIQILAKAAKDQFGIDIAPADPVPEKD